MRGWHSEKTRRPLDTQDIPRANKKNFHPARNLFLPNRPDRVKSYVYLLTGKVRRKMTICTRLIRKVEKKSIIKVYTEKINLARTVQPYFKTAPSRIYSGNLLKIRPVLRDVVNKQTSGEKVNFNYVDFALFSRKLSNEPSALLRLYHLQRMS